MRTTSILLLLLACNGPADDKSVDTEVNEETDPTVDTEPTVDTDTCPQLEADYAALVTPPACSGPEDCQVLNGQCGVGLGGCYELSNGAVTQAELDALGAAYSAASCTSAVCDCAEAAPVDCVDDVCAFTTTPPAPDCVWTVTSTLPDVTIAGPQVPCTYTLAQADLGVDFTWTLTVTEPRDVVVAAVSCAGLDPSGLRFRELISNTGTRGGSSLWCPRCDLGRCLPDEDASTTVVGTWPQTFTWRPRQWPGPSDFGQTPGDLFEPGDYELVVRAQGTLVDGGDPWEVKLETVVTLLP